MTPGEKDRTREMTYQVGWKRGKITLPSLPDSPPDGAPDAPGSRLLARLWQPLPALPLKALALLLVLLPAAGFAVILWLVALLARVKS